LEQRTNLCLILYVNKIDGYQYDSSESYVYGMYCRFGGGCKKSFTEHVAKVDEAYPSFRDPLAAVSKRDFFVIADYTDVPILR